MADVRVEIDEWIRFARALVGRAGATCMQFFQGEYRLDVKADSSPVSEADRSAERVMREMIAERYPADGVLGEEFEECESESGRRWILDPIDGTISFINGVPLFATLAGLEVEGRVVVGVVGFPGLGETVWAASGRGCWYGERRARVRDCARVEDALVCSTGMHATDVRHPAGVGPDEPSVALGQLVRRARVFRGWGDAYGHVLVATGRADVMVDPVVSPWDVAALLPILEESGATASTVWGERGGLLSGGSLVTTAGAIQDDVIRILGGEA